MDRTILRILKAVFNRAQLAPQLIDNLQSLGIRVVAFVEITDEICSGLTPRVPVLTKIVERAFGKRSWSLGKDGTKINAGNLLAFRAFSRVVWKATLAVTIVATAKRNDPATTLLNALALEILIMLVAHRKLKRTSRAAMCLSATLPHDLQLRESLETTTPFVSGDAEHSQAATGFLDTDCADLQSPNQRDIVPAKTRERALATSG